MSHLIHLLKDAHKNNDIGLADALPAHKSVVPAPIIPIICVTTESSSLTLVFYTSQMLKPREQRSKL